MSTGQTVDGVLVQWGERLFYPSNRIVKPQPTPRLEREIHLVRSNDKHDGRW